MKTKNASLTLVCLFMAIALMLSCNDKIVEKYTALAPVYMSYAELRKSVKISEPIDIVHPGKIYLKGKYIFINEHKKGVHVIDNTNPALPQKTAFINIPGNVDIAIKDSILYADSYIDLVAFDIHDLSNIKEVGVVHDMFPYMLPPIDYSKYQTNYRVAQVDKTQGVVIGWEVRNIEVDVEENRYNYYNRGGWEGDMMMNVKYSGVPTGGTTNSGIGIGGSMARFTIYENYLYALDEGNMKIFYISNLTSPVNTGKIDMLWGVETIFPYNKKLFLGTQTGLMIYSIENPAEPTKLSTFSHVKSCDPVVVEGNYAYVTLHSGNRCGANTNVLQVIDLSDIKFPELIKQYDMTEPYGLGIDNKTLFVCDGPAGLKVYDATDPLQIKSNKLAEFPNIQTYDVIPYNGVLIMSAKEGLYQYDYSNLKDIKQLSFLPIKADLEVK